MIYPTPMCSNGIEAARKNCKAVCIYGDEAEFASQRLSKHGFTVSQNAEVVISLKKRATRELNYLEKARRLTNEKFNIKTEPVGEKISISIEFAHRQGLFYALNRVVRGLKANRMFLGEITDCPLFAKRGYIEGFYGRPWNPEQRVKMLELLSFYGMNTYYYAPKDDPYHRDNWRELYPETELEKLAEICRICGENFVEFNYCIAPGLSMKYSDENEYQTLVRKVKQLYSIGVRGFGLLLDDIPERLYYEEDCARFDYETVNAHIYLANRLNDDLALLDKNTHLTVCPLVYHGRGDEYYISKLGKGLGACVSLFWTGKNICSQEITVPQAIRFEQATNHRPLYWDNFPVNDAEMQNEMHLGFLNGREDELYRYAEGLIANPMEYCLSSSLPLLTVADYLWNPLAYNGRESWQNALKILFGENAERFECFADNLMTSCLKSENSSIFNSVASAAQTALFAGNADEARKIFGSYLSKLGDCCEYLQSGDELLCELRPWIDKQLLAFEILKCCASVFDGRDEKERIRELLHTYLRLPEVLYDFSFECFVREVLKID